MLSLQRLLPILLLLAGHGSIAAGAKYASHPPMQPLPMPSSRPLGAGPMLFVDPLRGADKNDGAEAKPWKTVAHAVRRLKPGDTLVLRGGTYYESVTLAAAGTREKPITIRSYPGELAILDGGLREFHEDPAKAWEPVPGSDGEYRSTRTYIQGGGFGNFGDSMVPLHRYLNFADLRSSNEYWIPGLNDRQENAKGLYCGPGVRRDPETGRIHIRLAHTKLPGLGASAYAGETDPRKLPMVISGHDYTLQIRGARHVRIQDLVIRGGERAAVFIAEDAEDTEQDAEDIVLEGLTLYGSDMALQTRRTRGLKVIQCALHGHAAPWHSRAHHKYRAMAGYLALLAGKDFEIAHCDITDHHDAVQFYFLDGLRFHHNWLDNFNDDGLEPGPKKAHGQALIYQNVMTRCLSPVTLHGKKGEHPGAAKSEEGSGVYIFRNVFDLRQGTYRAIPQEAEPSGAYLDSPTGGVAHDHGSPIWPNYYVYHNTFLLKTPENRGNYGFHWAAGMRDNQRRVFNNIFYQVEGVPAFRIFPGATDDFEADGNLHWGPEAAAMKIDFFGKFQKSAVFEASKKRVPGGWFAHDRFADPKFVKLAPTPRASDWRLGKDSPAIDAGVAVPPNWPDPLRTLDPAKPDIGALPLGAEPLQAGKARGAK